MTGVARAHEASFCKVFPSLLPKKNKNGPDFRPGRCCFSWYSVRGSNPQGREAEGF